MVTTTEIGRLAAMANALRPDWPIQSVRTLLAADHSSRAFRDLAVALAAIATDPTTRTPRRLAESGPWWNAAQSVSGESSIQRYPPKLDDVWRHGCHEHVEALPCRWCAAEQKAGELPPVVRPAPEVATRGAAVVRTALVERVRKAATS